MRGYHTVHHRFQEVTRSQKVDVRCGVCGKPRQRTVTVTNTINPFNKNDLGQVRSPQEVLDCVRVELAKQAEKAAGQTIVCKPCRNIAAASAASRAA